MASATLLDRAIARRTAAAEQEPHYLPRERTVVYRLHAHRWYRIAHQLPRGCTGEARMSGYGRIEVRLLLATGVVVEGVGNTEVGAIRLALQQAEQLSSHQALTVD